MVSRTRIPSAMYPTGYTPPTPDGEVTPEVMTRDGSGEPHNKEMIQDYPCGDEAGHYFISSPLNVYSIGRSGAVVLYVEGGCPNFTWASDNAWATFGTATTSARYNTISSTSAEGQDTVVTVTDANGLEVTINVPWNGAASCCEDPPALSIQTPVAEVEGEFNICEVVVFIDGGCPPFTWATTTVGGTATLDYAATNSRRNRITGTATCWTLTVTDHCSQTATIGIYPMSVLDSHEFDEDYIEAPNAIHLAGEYYAVAYEGADDDGWIKTLRIITSTGVISEIDSYEYDTGNGANPRLIHVTGNIYAVANRSSYLFTIEISDEGVITEAIQDSEQIHVKALSYNNIVHIYSNVYAVVWRSSSTGENVHTYTISDAGAITAVDTYVPGFGYIVCWAALVTDNVVVTMRATDWGTFSVSTYEISNAGVITDPYLDNQAFAIPGEGHDAHHGQIWAVEVASNIFAMVHQDASVGTTVATFQVNDNGTIESSLLDSLLINADPSGGFPYIIYSGSSGIFYITYNGVDGDGFVYTVKITDAGIISAYNPCGVLEFETDVIANPYALTPSNGWFPVFYKGPGDDGWVKTIDEG